MARMCLYQSVDTVMLGMLFQLMKKSDTTGFFLVGIIYRTMLTHGCPSQNRIKKGGKVAAISKALGVSADWLLGLTEEDAR